MGMIKRVSGTFCVRARRPCAAALEPSPSRARPRCCRPRSQAAACLRSVQPHAPLLCRWPSPALAASHLSGTPPASSLPGRASDSAITPAAAAPPVRPAITSTAPAARHHVHSPDKCLPAQRAQRLGLAFGARGALQVRHAAAGAHAHMACEGEENARAQAVSGSQPRGGARRCVSDACAV